MQPPRAARGGVAALLLLLAVLAAAMTAVTDAKPLEPCPSACRCFLSEGLKRADCQHVPEWADRQSDAQDVRILPPPAGRGSRSSVLHLTHFEVFPKVLQLAVTNRSLVEVIPSGFHGLHSLQTLDLSNNQLSRFNYKVFLRMPALQRLILAGNHIVLEKDSALLTSKSLLSLDLSHCDIVDVPRGSLDGMSNLTSLSLRGNPLRLERNQPLLGPRTAVTELDLSSCELDAIPDGVLDVLTSLRRLYLDGNNLHTVERGVLPRGLHHLDLSGNRVRDVPTAVITALRNLTKLELTDNPVKCTCSLIGMQGWLSRRPVVMERPVVCDEPPQYRGLSWNKVDEMALCRAEESDSTTDTSETSSSSDESDDDENGDDAAAAGPSNYNGLGAAFEDSIIDSMEDLNPASYEHYTHENGLGSPSSAMPIKLHPLDANIHPQRSVSQNDINFFQADQADQPYDQTTARPSQDDAEATAATVPAEHAEHAEHAEPSEAETVEASAEVVKDAEAVGDDDAEDPATDEDVDDIQDEDVEESERDNPEENITEKDAEVFMRNSDTIAMGKSMPEETGDADKEAEEKAEQPAATAEPTVAANADKPTEAPVTEHVTEHVTEVATASTEIPAAALPSNEAHEQETEVLAEEIANPVAAVETGEHLAGVTLVDEADTTTTTAPVTESTATADEHGSEHEVGVEGHEHEGEVPLEETAPLAEEETSTSAPVTTTAVPDGLVVVPVGSVDGDRSAHGRALEGEPGQEPGHHEDPLEEHHGDGQDSIAPVVVAEPETTTSPPPTEAVQHAAENDADSIPIVLPEVTEESTTTPAAPVEPVPAETLPEEPISQAGEEDVGLAPVEPEVKIPDESEREPVNETIDPPKFVAGLEAVSPVPDSPADPVDNATPDTDAETVAAGGADDAKHNEELAVQRVTPGPGDASDPEAELQKSTITYVVLGCIVLAMVVLVLYALLRSKAKQADNGSGGKPARIRRENGDARSHGHPEGTEMKDMMNPLLGPGAAHPEHADQTEHGRRASLVSLELIREEEDETTRLQPAGADNEEGTLPRAKGAADIARVPEAVARTGNGKAAVPNGKSNGEANGKPNGKANGKPNGKANGKPAAEPASSPVSASTVAADPAATPRTQCAAEQPSKVKVKAGVISTPVPRTPVLVNRSNGVNGVNGVNGKANGHNRSA